MPCGDHGMVRGRSHYRTAATNGSHFWPRFSRNVGPTHFPKIVKTSAVVVEFSHAESGAQGNPSATTCSAVDAAWCHALGLLSSPLSAEWGGGYFADAACTTAPTPSPAPPQGGRGQTELAARIDSILTRHALKTRCCAAAQERTNTAILYRSRRRTARSRAHKLRFLDSRCCRECARISPLCAV